jgi:SHS2 domain-containing protein
VTATSRTLEHVGEWKVELRADTLPELFSELARVLAEECGRRLPSAAPCAWEPVELRAPDLAALLVDWANELIGRSEIATSAYGDVDQLVIEPVPTTAATASPPTPVTALRLLAGVRGYPVDEWLSAVKAATYHGATVERQGKEWRGEILLDV